MILEFSKTIEQFGLTPIEARLYAYLYLKEEALTLDQMSEDLGNSKTSMSNSVRSLDSAHLIEKVWRKGVRKHLYKANKEVYKSFMDMYQKKWLDVIEHQMEALESLKREIPKGKAEAERRKQLLSLFKFHKDLQDSFLGLGENKK